MMDNEVYSRETVTEKSKCGDCNHRSSDCIVNPGRLTSFLTGSSSFCRTSLDDIQRDLDTRIGLASNLHVVADRYLSPDDPDLLVLESAIDELRNAQTANEKAKANQNLTAATEHMHLKLQGLYLGLSVTDDRYCTQIRTDLASYNQIIGHSKYNEKVDQYNAEVLGKFPANILAQLTGVPKLESFR